ncbi:hypothetical protein [Fredinandcohnia sp. 179-A 10B2 NHS]|uniref:hypothetical protein n=1 Tax=Fredinandcohnia sp. 179-A 10B2 NHS TaxID=3235176 RepID=UPI0039A166E4
MESKVKLLNACKFIGGALFILGTVLFILGLSVSGYSILTPLGIGTVVGAVFIFLMGVFFVVTEEMLEKNYK